MLSWGRGKKKEVTKSQPVRTPAAPSPSAAATPPPAQRRHAPPVQPPQNLETALISEGQVTPEQLRTAMDLQKEKGGFLGQILIEEGFIDGGSFTAFLAKQCKIPHLSLLDYLIDDEVLGIIPKEICIKERLVPIDKLGRNLTVAMVNPMDTDALKQVRAVCPELRIKPILCENAHFEAVVAKCFGEKAEGESAIPEMTATSFGFSIPPEEVQALRAQHAEDAGDETPPEPQPVPAAPAAPAAVSAPATPATPTLDSDSMVSTCFAPMMNVPDAEPDAEPLPGDMSTGDTMTASDTTLMMRKMVSAMRDSMRDTYALLCRRVELFRGLEPETVAKIFAKGVTAEYKPGDYVFRKHDEGQELYVILSGSVKIEDDGATLAKLGQGDMFGEMALVSKEPRSASASALEPTSLLALSDDIIRCLLPSEAAIQMLVNIVVTVSRRLKSANIGTSDG